MVDAKNVRRIVKEGKLSILFVHYGGRCFTGKFFSKVQVQQHGRNIFVAHGLGHDQECAEKLPSPPWCRVCLGGYHYMSCVSFARVLL